MSDDALWAIARSVPGMGDPFFDLGNLAVNNDLDADADALLLRHAFGEVRDATVRRSPS